MNTIIKISCTIAAAPLLHIFAPLDLALADEITVKLKSRGCNQGSPNRCVLGAQLARRGKPLEGQVLQLLRSTDGGQSFARFGTSGRKTDRQGEVVFRFAAPDEETCYEVRTGPNGNARRDYYSRILCIGSSSNMNNEQNGEDGANIGNNANDSDDNDVDDNDVSEEFDEEVDATEESVNNEIDHIEEEADN